MLSHVENRVYKEILSFLTECEPCDKPSGNKTAEKTQAVIKGMQRHLKTLETQKSNLHDLLEQGIYDINTFDKRRNRLDDEMSEVRKNIGEQNRLLGLEYSRETKPFTADTYWKLTASEKNILLKQLISEITYEKSKSEKNDEFYLQIHYLF